MKKFIIFLSLFFLALSLPLAYFVLRAYRGLEQQETEELRYFATTLLDEINAELAALTLREEKRAVDEYSYYLLPDPSDASPQRSPLSHLPSEAYILGYFQNNPDGSFSAPFTEPGGSIPEKWQAPAERLMLANSRLNSMKIGNLSGELAIQPLGGGTRPLRKMRHRWNKSIWIFQSCWNKRTSAQEKRLRLNRKLRGISLPTFFVNRV